MVEPERLEALLLESVAKASPDQWVPRTFGQLTGGIAEMDSQAANASFPMLVDALKAMCATKRIEIRKWDNSARGFLPFDERRYGEDTYSANFFGGGSFELRLTHEGRKGLTPPPRDVATSSEEVDDLLRCLLRRKAFDTDLSTHMDKASHESEPLALLMIDVDHFKRINDEHGHPVGDKVLIACAERISKRVAKKGKPYRFGGEEIAILLPNFSRSEATALAEEIRKSIDGDRMTEKTLKVTVSIGVACFPDHADEPRSLLDRADKALYKAKQLGRNLVRVSGEPDLVPFDAGTVERRQPASTALSQEQKENIRRQYHQGRRPRCPKDHAILQMSEYQEGWFVSCPLCHLQDVVLDP